MLPRRACDTSRPIRTHYVPTICTQEVEPDVEAKAKAAIKAQKKRKSKAAVEDQVEGCGEPSTEPGPKRSRRIWDPTWDLATGTLPGAPVSYSSLTGSSLLAGALTRESALRIATPPRSSDLAGGRL